MFNYFDESKFTGFDSRDGFFAEKALKGHYNGAAKLHMTWVGPTDSAQDRSEEHTSELQSQR